MLRGKQIFIQDNVLDEKFYQLRSSRTVKRRGTKCIKETQNVAVVNSVVCFIGSLVFERNT